MIDYEYKILQTFGANQNIKSVFNPFFVENINYFWFGIDFKNEIVDVCRNVFLSKKKVCQTNLIFPSNDRKINFVVEGEK